ncbi:MAG: CpaF family protein [Actinomycetia bacterium]|nr:CpaF family protein [Actinomycetes bacterium]MCP5033243.1 CpaF family protein [Actinomycetes bacterium]
MSDLRPFTTEVRTMVGRDLSDWEAEQTAERGFTPSAEEAEVWGDQAIVRAVEVVSRRRLARGQAALSEAEEDTVIAAVRSWVFGHGVLDALLADNDNENIVANGYDNVTLTKVGGLRVPGPPLADSEEEFEHLIRRWAATEGKTERRFDDSQPYLDLRLPDGSRLHAIKGVTSRLCVSIRKHRHLTISLDELFRLGTIESSLAHTLACAIRPPLPCSILVAGGTDTGKTTFARGLISEIPVAERLIVIEDNAELGLEFDSERASHVVEMEVRQPNIEGVGGIGMDVLGRQALRMRPDRLIIGECRSGYEVRTMLEAMNSGHEGSLTTIHADSSRSALTKMQTYALTGSDSLSMEASASLISLVLHLVVHLRKLPDGTRVVSSVREITGSKGDQIHSNEVYTSYDDAGPAVPTSAGFTPRLLERLRASGYDHTVSLNGMEYR